MSKKIARYQAPIVTELSPEEVESLEKKLRDDADAWGYQIEPRMEVTLGKDWLPWIRRKPPGIRKMAKAIGRGVIKRIIQPFSRQQKPKKN